MQFPVEKHLVNQLSDFLSGKKMDDVTPFILNIGAGKSLSIEKQLSILGCDYICDRIDVNNCVVEFPTVRHCWTCSVEKMASADSGQYIASFANFVLEHVQDIHRASREIYRVLGPSGIFVATVPNPTAPEFQIARRTPFWFHKLIRREEAWETCYSYRDISELVKIFELNSLILQDIRYWSYVEGYLGKYSVLNGISKLYDHIVSASGIRHLMGHVCITFRKLI